MKLPFQFNLRGDEWYKLYFAYWVPILLLSLLSLARKTSTSTDTGVVFGQLALSLAIIFLEVLVQSFFLVPFLRTWFPRISVGGKSPSFAGDTTDYVKLNAVGFVLSVVTLGIYIPWYTKRVFDYLTKETSFDGVPVQFLGKPGRLFGILAAWTALFLGVLVAAVILFAVLGGGFASRDLSGTTLVVTGLVFVVTLLFMGPLFYLIYHWVVRFGWNGTTVRWNTRFWDSIGFTMGQILVTLITLGIYLPAACLRLFGYFVRRTEVEKDGAVIVRFGFDGKLGEGFPLLWGQILLTVVTLGFYYPWAFEKVAGWTAQNLWAEETASVSTIS